MAVGVAVGVVSEVTEPLSFPFNFLFFFSVFVSEIKIEVILHIGISQVMMVLSSYPTARIEPQGDISTEETGESVVIKEEKMELVVVEE